MKARVVGVSAVLVVLAICAVFVLHAVADVDETINRPDLVITKIVLDQKTGGQTPPFEISVWVKNVGTAAAAASNTAVMSTTRVGQTGRLQWGQNTNKVDILGAPKTIALAVGQETTVKVTVTGALSSRWFMFLADAPIGGHPSGQVGEGVFPDQMGGELNNSFAAPWDPGKGYTQQYANPVAP